MTRRLKDRNTTYFSRKVGVFNRVQDVWAKGYHVRVKVEHTCCRRTGCYIPSGNNCYFTVLQYIGMDNFSCQTLGHFLKEDTAMPCHEQRGAMSAPSGHYSLALSCQTIHQYWYTRPTRVKGTHLLSQRSQLSRNSETLSETGATPEP